MRRTNLPKWTLFVALAVSAVGSPLNPVSWSGPTAPLQAPPGGTALLHLRAAIEDGYHLYSLTTPPGGPIRTRIRVSASPGIVAAAAYQRKPASMLDPTFQIKVETFSGVTDFLIPFKLAPSLSEGAHRIEITVRYQACSDELCLAPVERVVQAIVMARHGASSAGIPAGYQQAEVLP
jgi:thiol:disulfide interchange protein DsbD